MRSAAELRHEFDATFAEPPRDARVETERFVSLRAGGNRFALSLADVRGVHAVSDILPLPSAVASQRGVVVVGGSLVAIHDLAQVMSLARADAPAWFAHVREGFALAFDEFDGQLVAAAEDVRWTTASNAAPHMKGGVRTAAGLHPIIDVQSIGMALTATNSAGNQREEA